MAIGDFFNLRFFSDEDNTPEFRRSLIRDYLLSEGSEDYSGSDILSAFRERGLGIASADFYEILRDTRGLTSDARRISRFGGDTIPTHDVFALNPHRQPNEYRYAIEYTYTDPDTGLERTDKRWIDSDFRRSKNDLIDTYNDYLSSEYPMKYDNLIDTKITRGYRRS